MYYFYHMWGVFFTEIKVFFHIWVPNKSQSIFYYNKILLDLNQKIKSGKWQNMQVQTVTDIIKHTEDRI